MSGTALVASAKRHIGETCILHAPKDNPNWKGPWACAEGVLALGCSGSELHRIDWD